MRWCRVLAVMIVSCLLAAAPAYGSAGRHAPVSPTARVVSQTPVPLTSGVSSPAEGPRATDVVWTRWTHQLVHGTPAIVEGQVLVSDGALPRVAVELQERPPGTSSWSEVATTVTSEETGIFLFEGHRPAASTDYRVVYRGDTLYSGSQAGEHVSVARRVRDAMVRRMDGSFLMRGSVAPSYRGGRVLLQRRPCARCAWSTVSAGVTRSTSRWSFDVAVPRSRRATWYYRTVVPADSRFVTGYGDHLWYVRRG